MAKDDVIELDGIVTDLLPSSKFKVSVTNLSIPVLCYIGGRLKQHKIRIIMGDAVPEVFCPEETLLDGRGCIVGTVDIVGCVNQSNSRWFFGEYGFQLANPVAFERPIPFKGALGFFDVPEHLPIGSKTVA